MASDEFIGLDAPCEADAQDERGDVQAKAPDANGVEPLASEHQPEGEAAPKPSAGNMDLEEGQLEDMDLEDDGVVVGKGQLLDASIQPEIRVAAVRTVIGFEVKLDKGDGAENAPIHESNSICVEESRILLNGVLCISTNIIYFCNFKCICLWKVHLYPLNPGNCTRIRSTDMHTWDAKHVIVIWGAISSCCSLICHF